MIAVTLSAIRNAYVQSSVSNIALGWITVISWTSLICCVRNDARLDTLVSVALPVPYAVDGGGGVCPQSSQPDGRVYLLDLPGGTYRQPSCQYRPLYSAFHRS